MVVRAGTREYRLADRRIWLGSDGVFGAAALIRTAPSVSVEALLPKRRRKRAEIRLEVAPLIEACAEDGQADLFRTRCADGALGPIKLDTRGFKLEAAEIQYPALNPPFRQKPLVTVPDHDIQGMRHETS